MYAEIARNKRRSVAYIVVFVALWLGVGALIGWLTATTLARRAGSAAPITADTTTGIVVAAILALAAVAFTLHSGTRLVLRIAGARPADPQEHRQLYDLVGGACHG